MKNNKLILKTQQKLKVKAIMFLLNKSIRFVEVQKNEIN